MNDTIIDTEFIFTSVPLVWFRTYHKILELLVCYGERKVINPNCKCSGSGSTIMECYELFQTAVAAYKLDKKEEGENIIKHIDSLLQGYESADSFVAEIDGKKYLFTKDDIQLIEDTDSDIYYGVFTPTTLINWQNTQDYIVSQLTNSVINSLSVIRDISSPIEETIVENNIVKTLVILIPSSLNVSVMRDAGLGGKDEFEGSFWRANGDAEIVINHAVYKIYGQMYSTNGDVKIYIDKV